MRPWWPSALALVAVAAQPAIAGGPTPDIAGGPTPDPAGLANLVRQDCGSFHGLTLKGELGKPLTADRLRHWDRAQLIHIILDGVPGTPMPAWRPLLTEAEAAWIANALKTGTLP